MFFLLFSFKVLEHYRNQYDCEGNDSVRMLRTYIQVLLALVNERFRKISKLFPFKLEYLIVIQTEVKPEARLESSLYFSYFEVDRFDLLAKAFYQV